MRWEAFCRALLNRHAPASLHSLEPPPENPEELARVARELLNSPTFRLAIQRVEAGLVERWRHTQIGARDEREAVFAIHVAIEELRAELGRMTTLGRRAA